MERERIDPGIREATLPYVPLLLAAWRGDAPTAAELTEAMAQGAADRGEGAALTYADHATAVLHNGLGNYEPAAAAAHRATAAGARREPRAPGERVRKRVDAPGTELPPQEQEVAQLAREGRTTREIGAQLFIGARTVEWPLRKVSANPGTSSRRELDAALSRR